MQLATDRMGNWVLVWDSKEDLNALGLGSDREIFVATGQSANPPNLIAGNRSVYGVLVLLLAFTGVVLGLTFVKRKH